MPNDPKTDIVELLEIKDLSEDMQIIAECAGMDTVRKLMSTCGGASFYVPKAERMLELLVRYIKKHYDGGRSLIANDKEQKVLAIKLGVSLLHIRHAIKIVREELR